MTWNKVKVNGQLNMNKIDNKQNTIIRFLKKPITQTVLSFLIVMAIYFSLIRGLAISLFAGFGFSKLIIMLDGIMIIGMVLYDTFVFYPETKKEQKNTFQSKRHLLEKLQKLDSEDLDDVRDHKRARRKYDNIFYKVFKVIAVILACIGIGLLYFTHYRIIAHYVIISGLLVVIVRGKLLYRHEEMKDSSPLLKSMFYIALMYFTLTYGVWILWNLIL